MRIDLLAAGAAPAFFTELAVLLVASAAIAYLSFRLGLVPIVGFLAAGVLIGPNALGLVRDPALTEAAAEVGVVLLLFTIGLEFSLDRLARIRRLILVGGGLQVALTLLATAGVLVALGVGWRNAVFTGALVALSSTAIVMKLLSDRGETRTPEGQAALGILVFQDLAVVAMVLLVPFLAGQGGAGGSGADVAWALARAVGIVIAVVLLARRVMPRILDAVARTCSQELFLLVVVAIAIGTAWLTSLAGVSLGLGAFLAGLLVSESPFRDHAVGEVLPLRILFSAAFFVSVGLLLDLSFLVRNPGLVAAVVVGAFLVKLLATSVGLLVLGRSPATTGFAALLLAQVGEFSFVLERAGRDAGLHAFGMADTGPQLFVAATVLLMALTPFQASLGRRWHDRARRRAAAAGDGADGAADAVPVASQCEGLDGHVLVAGYGERGRHLARALHHAGRSLVVLTLSPAGADEAEGAGHRVLRSDYAREHTLRSAGIDRAGALVVADDEPERTRHVVTVARMLHAGLPIHAYARGAHDAGELREAGADAVVVEEQAGVDALVRQVLDAGRNNGSTEESTMQATIGLRPDQVADGCAHAAQARPVAPSGPGCQECLATGGQWVHLRLCMACGHVGCCDSSPGKHARAHYAATGHPVIRSHEPGEDWAWCYEDEAFF